MIDDSSRPPADRGADATRGHLLPPADGQRSVLVLEPAAPRAIEWTADQLVAGGVVAFPTDTVYALAASLAHPAALQRIFAIKGRPVEKPLPILLASADDLEQVAVAVDTRVLLLLDRFWPGPLTVVVPARAGMPAEVLGPDHTIGARVPNHFLALEMIERAGGAIAATSANRSDETPLVRGSEVAAHLGDAIDVVLDGGVAPGGVPSTVIAFDQDQLRILRDGAIPRDQLFAAWQEIIEEKFTAEI
jgi:L-threonylcarbamoyladenylate synthase